MRILKKVFGSKITWSFFKTQKSSRLRSNEQFFHPCLEFNILSYWILLWMFDQFCCNSSSILIPFWVRIGSVFHGKNTNLSGPWQKGLMRRSDHVLWQILKIVIWRLIIGNMEFMILEILEFWMFEISYLWILKIVGSLTSKKK